MKFKTEVSAGGIVYKKEEDETLWLITQHSQHKGWGFPKGLIGDENKDEEKEEAALREVSEEGGITAKIVSAEPIVVKYKYKFQDTLVDKTVYFFIMQYLSGDPQNHDIEVSEAKFVPQDEVSKTLTYKTEKQAFEQAIKILA